LSRPALASECPPRLKVPPTRHVGAVLGVSSGGSRPGVRLWASGRAACS
jgi:hypothetical protein